MIKLRGNIQKNDLLNLQSEKGVSNQQILRMHFVIFILGFVKLYRNICYDQG